MKLAIKRKQLNEQVSEFTTNRLSVYLRCLNALGAAGVRTVSSQTLAQQFHLNAAQIRKDLAYFGEFGVRGVGYYVNDLKRHLRQILGLERKLKVAILGAGNLGLALADYPGFRQEGFQIVALFDTVTAKVGQQSRAGVPIFDIKDLRRIAAREKIGGEKGAREKALGIMVGGRREVFDRFLPLFQAMGKTIIYAGPSGCGQKTKLVNQVVAAGIKAILNFSPGTLRAPEGVKLKSVDLTVSLESLSFYLAREEE